jgi:SAM-dependent methyltransferase
MNDIERQRAHYDAIADSYYRARQNKNHIVLREAIWNFADIELKDNSMVLDAMCGYCDALELLKASTDKSFTYEAFDYSQPMIDLAKKKYPQAHVWRQDITQFKSDKKYDLILVMGALHHVHRHLNQSVANLASTLKEDGRFVIWEPVHNNIVFRKIREFIYKRNKLFDQETERGFTTKELHDVFSQQGLIPEKEFFPGLVAFVLWATPDMFPALSAVGGGGIAKAFLSIEKYLWKLKLAKFLSFSTMIVFKKRNEEKFLY